MGAKELLKLIEVIAALATGSLAGILTIVALRYKDRIYRVERDRARYIFRAKKKDRTKDESNHPSGDVVAAG